MWATNIAISHADTGLMAAEVVHAEHISPNFVRVTLGGEELHHWRSLGYDQWFRLALPASDETRFDMRGFLRYLTLPKSTRPVIRNFTVRNYSADRGEIDVDFVAHGEVVAGPWADSLPIGAPVALIDQGCGYRPVADTTEVLLTGDESALPAIMGILRDLPRDSTGTAIVEIPHRDDEQSVPAPPGVELQWIVRDGQARPGASALNTIKGLPPRNQPVSAFLAGEQQLATGARRHLVTGLGVPKSSIDFTGYWRYR